MAVPLDERACGGLRFARRPERYLHASLAAAQIVGVAMSRYVAPTVQRYLSGRL
jgi:hypothetical protein